MAQRTVFRLGYPLARAWWWAVPQAAEGVALVVSHAGRILVVRQSFRKGLGLPGGGLAAGEAPVDAGARELAEEVDIVVESRRLEALDQIELVHECRQLRVHLFGLELAELPPVHPDGAEVISAAWMDPDRLRSRTDLHPVLAHWLETKGPRPGPS